MKGRNREITNVVVPELIYDDDDDDNNNNTNSEISNELFSFINDKQQVNERDSIDSTLQEFLDTSDNDENAEELSIVDVPDAFNSLINYKYEKKSCEPKISANLRKISDHEKRMKLEEIEKKRIEDKKAWNENWKNLRKKYSKEKELIEANQILQSNNYANIEPVVEGSKSIEHLKDDFSNNLLPSSRCSNRNCGLLVNGISNRVVLYCSTKHQCIFHRHCWRKVLVDINPIWISKTKNIDKEVHYCAKLGTPDCEGYFTMMEDYKYRKEIDKFINETIHFPTPSLLQANKDEKQQPLLREKRKPSRCPLKDQASLKCTSVETANNEIKLPQIPQSNLKIVAIPYGNTTTKNEIVGSLNSRRVQDEVYAQNSTDIDEAQTIAASLFVGVEAERDTRNLLNADSNELEVKESQSKIKTKTCTTTVAIEPNDRGVHNNIEGNRREVDRDVRKNSDSKPPKSLTKSQAKNYKRTLKRKNNTVNLLVEKQIVENDGECKICLNKFCAKMVVLPQCRHTLCINCVMSLVPISGGDTPGEKSCPFCTNRFKPVDCRPIPDKILKRVKEQVLDGQDEENLDISGSVIPPNERESYHQAIENRNRNETEVNATKNSILKVHLNGNWQCCHCKNWNNDQSAIGLLVNGRSESQESNCTVCDNTSILSI